MNVSRAAGLDPGGTGVDLAESVMAHGRIWGGSGMDLGWIEIGSWMDLGRTCFVVLICIRCAEVVESSKD